MRVSPVLGAAWLGAALLVGCGGGGGGSAATSEPSAPAAALPDSAGVSFSAQSVRAGEDVRHLPIGVTRTGAGHGRTVVAWRLREGSAHLGSDVAASEGRLVWEDGQSGERTIDLLVHSDLEQELPETLSLTLEPIEGDAPTMEPLSITIDDVACDAELTGTVASDRTLDAACYRMPSDVSVVGGARLMLTPGSTLIAGAGVRLDVVDDAILIAEGTPRRPVSLVGANRVSGYWQGVGIGSRSPLQQLVDVHVSDAVIGIDVAGTSALARLEGGAFDNTSVAAIRLPIADADVLGAATRITRSPGGVLLRDTTVRADVELTLPALSAHYSVNDNLLVSGAVSIAAGAELRFAQDRLMWVDRNGSIDAVGTADAPIVLRGTTAAPGHWRGVQLIDSAADNRLEHVTIAHGGRDVTRDGNLSLSGQATRLSARHVLLSDSAGVGLWLGGTLPDTLLDAMSFRDNAVAQVRRGTQTGDFGTL